MTVMAIVPFDPGGRKLCCDGFAGSLGANAILSFVYWFSYEYSPGLVRDNTRRHPGGSRTTSPGLDGSSSLPTGTIIFLNASTTFVESNAEVSKNSILFLLAKRAASNVET